ncbi:MAG: hypothetical protein RJB38_1726 [Pseudomonadota bacterium]|jgi:nitroreductase
MDFFETLERRRSIRKFSLDPVPEAVIEKALDAAILAPNSSNLQAWDFYWVRTPEAKAALVQACFSQAAARTAQELVVIVADFRKWKRSLAPLLRFIEAVKAPKPVISYYQTLIPLMYRPGLGSVLGMFRAVLAWGTGFFRPVPRVPYTFRDLQEVAMKSSALAAENFVLAISAQGYSSCMMEGFDEHRVRRLLKLPRGARITMVIAVGKEKDLESGTWGPRFRIPREEVIHRI